MITHDAGSPRDQLSPFWQTTTPLSYIGWGKTTQLGYGLGLAMGAKLAAARQAVHEHVGRRGHRHDGHGLRDGGPRQHPDHVDPVQQLLDGHGDPGDEDLRPRSTTRPTSPATTPTSPRPSAATASASPTPDEIIPAIKRGVEQTKEGRPVLLEFITQQGDRVLPPSRLRKRPAPGAGHGLTAERVRSATQGPASESRPALLFFWLEDLVVASLSALSTVVARS